MMSLDCQVLFSRPKEWVVEAVSALADNKPAPLEYFVRTLYGWHELWVKDALPPARRYPIMGLGREQADHGWASVGY